MNQQTRRVRAGHPMTADHLNLHRVDGSLLEGSHARVVQGKHEQKPLPIDVAVPDDDPERWTFAEWLFAFLFGFCVLMACVAAILSISN